MDSADRYWAKVDRRGDDECWPWTAAKIGGYGVFWGGGKYPSGRPKMVKAHRWAYEAFVGPVSRDLMVCHTCDEPSCQNPRHWFLGTAADNNRDRSRKGRSFTGPRKLTAAQVAEVRRRYAAGGISQQALADEFGVSQTGVSLLLRS